MICHLTLAVRGRQALARTEAERRAVVRALGRVGGSSLLLFNVVDDHLHLVVRDARPAVVGRSIRLALRGLRPELAWKPTHVEPVGNRAYLRSLVRYVFQQSSGLGLEGDALWSGSSFQDLVGARVVPGIRPGGIFEELPRLRWGDVFGWVGVSARGIRPAGATNIEAACRAASAACCADPSLVGRTLAVQRALRVVVRLSDDADLSPAELRRGIGLTRSGISRLRSRPPEPRDLQAARIRLGLGALSSA